MLQNIRDKFSGWVAWFFLGAIAVVFIFWGVNFEGASSTYAAKVNGEKIAVETVVRAWQQRLSQLQQMMRGDLPAELLKSQQQAMLDEFVRRELLEQRATDLGYRVSDLALARQIHEFPQLQIDGKFSRDRYAMLLRQQGRTERQFEAELRSDLAIRQIQSGIADSAFAVPYELERRYALEKQEREVDYALIPSASFASQVNVTDEQIQSWYDENQSDYMLPETVDLQYVELTRERAEAAVSITDQVLREYYDQVKDRFESPERRRARHILIAVDDGLDDAAAKKKADELAAEAQAGADFAQLATKNSKDPGSAQQGGDLGWAERGMFVGPFEDTLFSMQSGEIRGPIKTQFGYHIIRLDEVEGGDVRTFDEVRAEIEAEYRADRSQSIFYDETQRLADQAFASLTELEPVAQAFDLPLQTIEGLTRNGSEAAGEVGSDPAVIEAAFSEEVLNRGQNSALVTVGEDRALVLRVANHKPAVARPLADVRTEIEAELRTRAAREAAQQKGAEALAKLQQGTAWQEVMSQMNLNPAGKRFIGRQDGVAPQSVTRAAFAVAPAQVSQASPYHGNVATDEGNYAVIAVSSVRNGDPAAEPETERSGRRASVERQIGNEEFTAYVAEVERTADIVRNEKVFE